MELLKETQQKKNSEKDDGWSNKVAGCRVSDKRQQRRGIRMYGRTWALMLKSRHRLIDWYRLKDAQKLAHCK